MTDLRSCISYLTKGIEFGSWAMLLGSFGICLASFLIEDYSLLFVSVGIIVLSSFVLGVSTSKYIKEFKPLSLIFLAFSLFALGTLNTLFPLMFYKLDLDPDVGKVWGAGSFAVSLLVLGTIIIFMINIIDAVIHKFWDVKRKKVYD